MAITKVSPDLLDLDSGITITTADNSDNLTLTSTDADANVAPNLRMYRNSSSPADSDQLGKISLVGRNDNSQDVIYGQIGSQIKDASDGTEDGRVFINSIVGGTTVSRIDMTEGETVFNNDSVDLDFRVESNDEANMIFVNAGGNAVGIGTATPSGRFAIQMAHTETNVTLANNNETLVLGNSGSGNGVYNAIKFSGNQQDMYIMSFNDQQIAARRIGFFLGSVAGDAVADERLSIRGDGKVGIGTSSPGATLHVDASGGANFQVSRTGVSDMFYVEADGTNAVVRNPGSNDLVFQMGGTSEKMRIKGNGEIRIGSSNDYSSKLLALQDAADHRGFTAECTSGSFADIAIDASCTRNTANATYRLYQGQRRGTAVVFSVNDAGNVQNVNNSFTGLSDQRLKTNIADAGSQWDDIKALKVRTYQWGMGNTGHTQLGVISQEVEAAGMNGLVEESLADEYHIAYDSSLEGEKIKSVKYSVLYMKAVKALQEAMTKIEALEARVTTLEG